MTRRRTSALIAGLAGLALLLSGCSEGSDSEPETAPSESTETAEQDGTGEPDNGEQTGPSPGGEFTSIEDYHAQELDWATCEDDDQYQCATLTVPLDHDDPAGQTIEIAVLRSPATSGEAQGSLVVNPGGPGGSGVDYAKTGDQIATEDVLAAYDVVGFDPRGVGRSTPIDCLDDQELDAYVSEGGTPEDEEDIADAQEIGQEFIEGCQANSGEMLPHLGTADVARDLDILRATLGEEQLTYLGKSYGTFIGALYAELFPDRAGRLVLDGAIDPSLSGRELSLGQAEGFEVALSSFLDWCVEQESCSLGASESEARSTLEQLLTDVESEPLPTDDSERPLTSGLMMLGVVLPLYLPADQGYPVLDQALSRALDGDGQGLMLLADTYLMRNPDGSYNGNQNEVIVAVNCLDRPSDASVEEIEDGVAEFEEASPTFGSFLALGDLTCAQWPAEPESEPAPVSADGAEPILVVGTTGDPATPYEWAESLAEQLSSGVLLTYEGAVHTAYRSGSSCVDERVDAYLLGDETPQQGETCT